jgi:hypothetical protein
MVYFQKPTPKYLKFFPVYLFCALIVDLRGEWLVWHGHYNTGLANVWGILEFCFYYFVMHEVIISVKIKRIIFYISIAFALFAFYNIIFIQHKVGFNPVNFTIGCLITVSICIYYFVELFQKVEALSLSRLPAFWICTGILFNTVLSFPTFALESFLEESSKVSRATQLLYQNLDSVMLFVIGFTFILYAIGFLCRIRISKSTL